MDSWHSRIRYHMSTTGTVPLLDMLLLQMDPELLGAIGDKVAIRDHTGSVEMFLSLWGRRHFTPQNPRGDVVACIAYGHIERLWQILSLMPSKRHQAAVAMIQHHRNDLLGEFLERYSPPSNGMRHSLFGVSVSCRNHEAWAVLEKRCEAKDIPTELDFPGCVASSGDTELMRKLILLHSNDTTVLEGCVANVMQEDHIELFKLLQPVLYPSAGDVRPLIPACLSVRCAKILQFLLETYPDVRNILNDIYGNTWNLFTTASDEFAEVLCEHLG